MPQLALYLLGPPRVEREGKEVHIGRSKAVALLAYLAVEPRRHSRDALAESLPLVANSQLFADIAGKHIAAAAATLTPDVVEAAQARGRKLDWWETAAELLHELRSLGWEGTPPYMEEQGLES